MKNLLVLGARDGSIGDYVRKRAETEWNVHTVGVSEEDTLIDCSQPLHAETGKEIYNVINAQPWHAVICTLGVNHETRLADDHDLIAVRRMATDFNINVLAVMVWLEEWLLFWARHEDDGEYIPNHLHFAAISSNSARVPRSTGLSYCASKAALSQAIRCVARDWAKRDGRVSVYGYEPGWVEDTPMSKSVRRRMEPTGLVTRAPGGRALTRSDLARMIVANLSLGHAINGSMIRVDGGEV